MPYYLNSTKLRVAGGGGNPVGNVLAFSTQATYIVEATMQRHAPNVHAIRLVFIWVSVELIIAMAIVSGEVTTSVVYAI